MRPLAALAAAACLLALSGLAAPRVQAEGRPENVDVLLVLAADVSRSIDDGEFNLQRKGYAAAMTDPRVLRAIAGGPHHAIALTFVEWAGESDQKIVVDWTVLRDEEGAAGVAAAILAAPRSYVGRTSISGAIDFAVARFAAAPAKGDKRIIDVSGDGTSNAGRAVTEARDAAVAAGITINALAIINNQTNVGYAFHTHPPGGLPKYFADNVVGGPGNFLLQVEDFGTFADAISRKLVAEIARTPAMQRSAGADLAR
ncbi:MAG TPA: DUF1194 domain-containing protein [Stellaceae bacterium]|nr:DUF1194 domain-containing protein [Stellaceae bacterium]